MKELHKKPMQFFFVQPLTHCEVKSNKSFLLQQQKQQQHSKHVIILKIVLQHSSEAQLG